MGSIRMIVFRKALAVAFTVVSLVFSTASTAAEWCSFAPGAFIVITHGTKSDNVWLNGSFVGNTAGVWVPIANATYGKSSVSLAIAAQIAGKGVSVYLDGQNDTCANYVTWAGVIRHVKIDD